ncbi:hypothetical protein M569_07254 [Genlisea aurea]|uniref:Condensation domain-containing protein n=1 Tax=Genlisea aurea TaxID=192259 RepID=S8DWG3_9LAMI|nr:hypothetical protein M569_07254 [Genlisea aurea]
MAGSDGAAEIIFRPTGKTELSWCKAVPGGTGITVLSILISNRIDSQLLQNSLRKLQIAHPILRSKIRFDPDSNSFSYAIPVNPAVQLQRFDLQSTAQILQSSPAAASISPHQLLLEHELNINPWGNSAPPSDTDVFFASLYELESGKRVLALRFHASVCDRASASALLEELLRFAAAPEMAAETAESGLGIEEYIPSGQADKPFWARAADMAGYSLNSLRFAHLNFVDRNSPRTSRVARFQIGEQETDKILSECEAQGMKLSAAIAAAGLIAAHSSKRISEDDYEKYAVVTLVNCRPLLDPVLDANQIGKRRPPPEKKKQFHRPLIAFITADAGFYHSAIINSHDVKGGETLWPLAKRVHSSLAKAKANRKHFTDMDDINFMTCKAIENPGFTPSRSLRTSLVTVFEEPVSEEQRFVDGLEDVLGCFSVHGIGPSVAVFDAIRGGRLDCACVYPFPLHSREQIRELIDEMKRILVDGSAAA